MKKPANNQYLKQINRSQILDLVRSHEKIARISLTKLTGLSATAVGSIVSDLVSEGYLFENGIAPSTGGRKQVYLSLKADSYYSIGIDIDKYYIKYLVLNLKSEIIFQETVPLPEPVTFHDFYLSALQKLNQIKTRLQLIDNQLLGIGISVPGFIDSNKAVLLKAPNLNWENISLAFYHDNSPYPLYFENEANSAALSEKWLGACRELKDFIIINIKTGIGAGIYTNGRIYHGSSGTAGEIGHIVADNDGPACSCGNYGCLEQLASTESIIKKAKNLIRQGTSGHLNQYSPEEINLEDIVVGAKKDDFNCKKLVLEASQSLAFAISILINSLNPEAVVLGKDFCLYSDIVMDDLREIVKNKTLAGFNNLQCSKLGMDSSAIGAGVLPLQRVFGK